MSYCGACPAHAAIGFVPGCPTCLSMNTTVCLKHKSMPEVGCPDCVTGTNSE